MSETRKIVTDDFPVEGLPEELRRGLEIGQVVRVTIETGTREPVERRGPLASFFGSGQGCYSEAEAVTFIRQLRDE